jgi:endonuclease/exonuclease/phosphatase family metal-dependent hydrolase
VSIFEENAIDNGSLGASPARRRTRLRVVTWNVHGCVGADRRFDPGRVAVALDALAPDVALLQEVGDSRGVHPPIDQATAIANALGLTCAVGITMPREPFGYGNATLSRYPVLDSETFDLSVRGREPRACLRVVVGRDELRLVTLNVHLGLGAGERRHQLRILVDAALAGALGPARGGWFRRARPIGEVPSVALVMGGDFNDFPPGPVSRTFGERLLDAGARLPLQRTFPASRPLLRLDRVYVSHAVHVIATRVDRSPAARAASDHLPVVVEVEVAAGSQEESAALSAD